MRKLALFTTLVHLSCSSGSKGDSGRDDDAPDSDSGAAGDSVPETGDSVADTGDSASEAGLVRELATADAIVRSDVCGQTFGGAIFTNIDLNGDGLEDVLVTGSSPYCEDSSAWYGFYSSSTPDSVWDWVPGETTARSSADVIIGSVPTDGTQGRPAGDVDGDGFDDLLSASCGSEQMPCLLFGPFAWELDPDSARMVRFEGPQVDIDQGNLLFGDMAAGDLDGDGAVDVVVSDAGYSHSAYVIYGPVDRDMDMDLDSYRISGVGEEEFGWDAAIPGDLDGDGVGELAVSAIYEGWSYGAIYLYRAPVLADISYSDADATVNGDPSGQGLGDIWPLGDLNGDGYDDLVLGGDTESHAGAVFVIYGPGPADGDSTVASADARLLGEAEGDEADSVARAGDINDDGFADVFVGATQPDVDLGKAGVSYLVLGPLAGSMSLADSAVRFPGTSAGEQAGIVAGNVDLNSDGELDLVVGAPGWPTPALSNGSIYGLFGPLM